jgi:peroxiredoxin
MRHAGIAVLTLAVAALSAWAGYQLQRGHAPDAARGVDATTATHLQVTARTDADIRIPDLEGREHSLSEWRGMVLVVNFWATWCPPCVVEIPGFIGLQQELGPEGLQFVGIALDDPEAARRFATERGVNYPVLVGSDEVTRLMQQLGNAVGALPYTVVFDRAGGIAHTHQGEWREADARATLRAALAATPAPTQAAR